MNVGGASLEPRPGAWTMGVVAAAVAAGCARAMPPERAASSAPGGPQVSLEHPEFGESAGGQPVWTATAARAHYGPDAQVADLQAVEARFYEDGRLVTRCAAPAATWRQAAHDLRLSGGITLASVASAGGVAAREARWDPGAGRLRAEGGVRFWQGHNELQAQTLRADRALRRVELVGGVRGRFALGPGTLAVWQRSTPTRRSP